MYRCQQCKLVSPRGQRAVHIVVEGRRRAYPERSRPAGRHGERRVTQTAGEGWETVRSLTVCPSCAAELERSLPEGPRMIEAPAREPVDAPAMPPEDS